MDTEPSEKSLFCDHFVKCDVYLSKCVCFRFQLVPRTQEGQVFPPLLTVAYRDVLMDNNTHTVSVSWSNTNTLLQL